MTGREAGEVYGALFAWRAPLRGGAFEFVLIVQHVAGAEAQADEVNLHLVLVGDEIGQSEVAFTKRRERLW